MLTKFFTDLNELLLNIGDPLKVGFNKFESNLIPIEEHIFFKVFSFRLIKFSNLIIIILFLYFFF